MLCVKQCVCVAQWIGENDCVPAALETSVRIYVLSMSFEELGKGAIR